MIDNKWVTKCDVCGATENLIDVHVCAGVGINFDFCVTCDRTRQDECNKVILDALAKIGEERRARNAALGIPEPIVQKSLWRKFCELVGW